MVGVVAPVSSVLRQAWRGAGAISECRGAVRRAACGRNGQPAAPRPLPASAALAAARLVRREGSAGAGRCGGRPHGGGGPPAGWEGAVRPAVSGGNGAPAVTSQLWAAAAPRWRRRAGSGGGGSRRRRRRDRAVALRRLRWPSAAAAVAAVTDALAGSSTAKVDARHMGRWAPQPSSIAISCKVPHRRTRRRRPHLRPFATFGGRQRASLEGHSALASADAFRPKLRE